MYRKIRQKLKCEQHSKCVAYTYEESRLICLLHSTTGKGQKYTRGKQTGVKKTDYKLSLPEISLCSDKNRQRRCRREPKCNHVDCFRNAQDYFTVLPPLWYQLGLVPNEIGRLRTHIFLRPLPWLKFKDSYSFDRRRIEL